MKQPKLSDFKLDKKGTKDLRSAIKKVQNVKITINFDVDVLDEVKDLAESVGAPYQILLNKLVKDSLKLQKTKDTRLDKLEKEVAKIKKKIAA